MSSDQNRSLTEYVRAPARYVIPAELDTREPAFEQQPFALRDMLIFLFKDWKRISIAFLIPVIAAIGIAFAISPKFEAKSVLLVRIGSEYSLRSDTGEAILSGVDLNKDEILKSEVEILLSSAVLENAIDATGIYRLFPDLAKQADQKKAKALAITELGAALDVVPVKASNIITLSIKHPDASVARDIVNNVIAAYLAKRTTIFADPRAGILGQQFVDAKAKLEDVTNEIDRLKRENNISDIAQERSLLLQQRSALDSALKQVVTQLPELQNRLDSLRKSGASTKPQVELYAETSRPQATDMANQELTRLQIAESDLTKQYGPNHPKVKQIREQLRDVERIVGQQRQSVSSAVRIGRNPAKDLLDAQTITASAELAAATASEDVLQHQIDEVDQKLTKLSTVAYQLDQLTLRQSVLEATYRSFAQKTDEARALDQLDQKHAENVRVVEEARLPVKPTGYRVAIALVGGMVGVFFAAVVALLSIMLRDTFVTPQQIEKAFGLPVLAALPDMRVPRVGHP
ncbi:GumC family protein [Dongia soli]|uniref:Lipopolysaccharide biosynthesis protein n=1 Tax=Dongia soli TaxID=600628 RepID=A0ABU5EDW5_9PROT|nr:hypothetical protein [Dongia soli]MDY0884254.1 hypothetical protein [Dongia soli]